MATPIINERGSGMSDFSGRVALVTGAGGGIGAGDRRWPVSRRRDRRRAGTHPSQPGKDRRHAP